MEIKDYLHLYLGCDVKTSEGIGNLIRVGDSERGEDCEVSIQNDDEESGFYGEWADFDFEHNKVKPILRLLSDMTEEECEFFYHRYFDKRYAEDWSGDTGSANFKPKRVKPTFTHIKRIIDGEDYSSDGFMRTVELTKWMIDLHFDLFGLCSAGLAIDATKLLNKDQGVQASVASKAK